MDNAMLIPLTKGRHAIVDVAVIPVLSRYKWQYRQDKNTGYAQTRMPRNGKRVTVHMHRHIWESVHGPIPSSLTIDHINRNGLDNRIANLRLADQHLQSVNKRRKREGLTTSSYDGVSWSEHARKWITHLQIGSAQHHLGVFEHEIDAYTAYTSALKTYRETGEVPKPKPTSSRYRGVHWHRRDAKWVAKVNRRRVVYHLGYFNSELDAYNARQDFLRNYEAGNTDIA